ncbi:MAG: adenylate/guanylate cyclase domain-containing protein [Candidatus Lindowbacteria bacterium]|nr:adenylate/guanylate cyclase domain-containing protein [Candidatus Lindowbacteria bacterium]
MSESSSRQSTLFRNRLILSITVSIIISTLVLLDPFGQINNFEMQLLDARHRFFASKTKNTDNIVIVDISEDSIRVLEPVYGRWPWPRSVHGELVEYLTQEGAKVIGFDVIFAERTTRAEIREDEIVELVNIARSSKSPSSNEKLALALESLKPSRSDDYFSKASKKSNRVVQSALFFTSEAEYSRQKTRVTDQTDAIDILNTLKLSSIDLKNPLPIPIFYSAAVPISGVAEAASAIGLVNFTPDQDGPCRRSYLLAGFQNNKKAYPSLPLAMAALARNIEFSSIKVQNDGILLGEQWIPTQHDGSQLIKYQGGSFQKDEAGASFFTPFYKTFPYYAALLSMEQIQAGEKPIIPKDSFKDKIVIIGSTAAGLKDLRATPFNATSPGVEIHANILDSILSNEFLVPPHVYTQWLMLSCIVLFVSLASGLTGPWAGLGIGGGIVALSTGSSWYAFESGYVLPMAPQLVGGTFAFLGVILFRYIIEEREKRMLRSAFGHYLSPAVLEEVMQNPDSLELGGRKKNMTVLFSDVPGFTQISEGLEPEQVSQILNVYLTTMTDCILKTGGTLDKFIGDAVVAEWNAPLNLPDHAARACESALMMVEELQKLHEIWKIEGKPLLHIRIGINSGEMVVGNMGSEALFDYTVIGNEVNTGARLEPLNKEFGTQIAISHETREQARRFRPDDFFTRQLARVKVIGRKTALEVYELVGNSDTLSITTKDMVLKFKKGMRLYLSRQFIEARHIFEECIEMVANDGPALKYIKLCKEYELNPPPENWDGTYEQKSK